MTTWCASSKSTSYLSCSRLEKLGYERRRMNRKRPTVCRTLVAVGQRKTPLYACKIGKLIQCLLHVSGSIDIKYPSKYSLDKIMITSKWEDRRCRSVKLLALVNVGIKPCSYARMQMRSIFFRLNHIAHMFPHVNPLAKTYLAH